VQIKPSPLEGHQTAYHEAGHAVLQFFLHLSVKRVSIRADHKTATLGHTLIRRPAGLSHP
jgi:hypothetical protein